MSRIAIQVLSFNRPEYLEQTLDSLKKVISQDDKLCVLEQSDDLEAKKKCVDICKKHKDIKLIESLENLGQRGATNAVYNSGFFNDSQFVMISDHDNIFHEPLDVYCEKLNNDASIFIATGYSVFDHDIERKDWSWLIKSTGRAGHMVMRSKDFLTLMPIDLNYTAGVSCGWYCGLDWWLTHWGTYLHPGIRQEKEFIACYPGGVEHIGKSSTWQGEYVTDDPDLETLLWMRTASLSQIIAKFPPRHSYLSYAYSYEKAKTQNLPEGISEYVYNVFGNNIAVYDTSASESNYAIYNELIKDDYNISNIDFKSGDIVIDIGANVGMFSIALAKKYPNIKIYAFEPLEVTYDNLQRGIKANDVSNVIAINCAVTKDSRDVAIICATNSGGAIVLEKDLINTEVTSDKFKVNTCQSLSLFDIFDKFKISDCRLLKIDTEGFEYDIFGAENIGEVLSKIEYLSAEFHFNGIENLVTKIKQYIPENKFKYTTVFEGLDRPKQLIDVLKTVMQWNHEKANAALKILRPTENKKVHILIPTYQRYNLLQSILRDISNQTYKDFDVTVCSDGYDETTKNIVNEFNSNFENIYTYCNTPERANDWGRTPREKLISTIKDGNEDYIVFIDDDDCICTHYLEKLTEGCQYDTISYCNMFSVDEFILYPERIIPGGEVDSFEYGKISCFCCLLPVDVVKNCFHKWNEVRDSDFQFIKECSLHKKLKYIPYVLCVAR